MAGDVCIYNPICSILYIILLVLQPHYIIKIYHNFLRKLRKSMLGHKSCAYIGNMMFDAGKN